MEKVFQANRHATERMRQRKTPGMARATRGATTRVMGMPTNETRPKCQATRGRVATVAETPAPIPLQRDAGILPLVVPEIHV